MKAILLGIQTYFPLVLTGVIAIEQQIKAEKGASKKQILVDTIDTAAKLGETAGNADVALVSTLIDVTVASLNATGAAGFGKTAAAPAPTPAS
jgi:hypothetical protein